MGLVVSLILFLTIIPLLRIPYDLADPLDALGFLQLVWVMSTHKELADRVGTSGDRPTTDILRMVGAREDVTPVGCGAGKSRPRWRQRGVSLHTRNPGGASSLMYI